MYFQHYLGKEDCTNEQCGRRFEEKRLEIRRLKSSIDELRKQCAEKDREIERYRNAEKEAKKKKEKKEVEVSVTQ